VKEHYNGKCIFITGASGFLAKVVLEKILFSCPNVKKIYLLIRGKKNLTPMDRLKKEVFGGLCFQRLRKMLGPKGFEQMINEKIQAVAGDITQPRLGISNQDALELSQNVNIFIHSAADVGFGNTAQHMFRVNYYGGMEALGLAKTFINLTCYTYISTFTSNLDIQDQG